MVLKLNVADHLLKIYFVSISSHTCAQLDERINFFNDLRIKRSFTFWIAYTFLKRSVANDLFNITTSQQLKISAQQFIYCVVFHGKCMQTKEEEKNTRTKIKLKKGLRKRDEKRRTHTETSKKGNGKKWYNEENQRKRKTKPIAT